MTTSIQPNWQTMPVPTPAPKRSKGNPPMRVRHTPEQRELWHQAAQRAGVAYSDWVRDTLTAEARRVLGLTPGGHAQVPTSDQAISAALAQLGPDAISPEAQQQVEQAMAADCPHLAWVKGSSGLQFCAQCRKPKALVMGT